VILIKKLTKLLAAVLSITLLSGCWDQNELNARAIVIGVAVDRGEHAPVKITAQIARASAIDTPQKGKSAGEKFYWNIENEGQTIFDIIRGFNHESSRKLYFPHNQIIMISKELAEEGILQYLDFFMRDHETRLDVDIAVAEGKAAQLLDVKPELETLPAINLSILINSYQPMSHTISVDLHEFMDMLIGYSAAICPIVNLSHQSGMEVLGVTGTAVFIRDKMVGYLDPNMTRGMLWAKNKVKGGIVSVTDGQGQFEVEIKKATSKRKLEYVDGKLKVKIKAKLEGTIGSHTGGAKIQDPEVIKKIENLCNQRIKEEIVVAHDEAKRLKADVFDYANELYKKSPKLWEQIKQDWPNIFDNMELDIDASTNISGTGRIVQPVIPN